MIYKKQLEKNMNPDTFLTQYSQEFIEIRQQLHRLAEPSTLEYETGAFLKEKLSAWGISYLSPMAGTGLVALIPGKLPGPGHVIALRADMDALPIFEDTDCPYRAKTPGLMHACGHDAHMTIALGAARYFKLAEEAFAGCVKIFFQPAEETIGGAARMISEGCMENPHVDCVLGLHLAPYLNTGEIEVKYGHMYAASDELNITLYGQSCHGAYPDTGVDAIAMSAHLISSLQSLTSRFVSPLAQCVLSFGTIHGGTARNVIADTVELTGILRTTDSETRGRVKELLMLQAEGITKAWGGQSLVTITPGYDSLCNTDWLVEELRAAAIPILGKEHVLWKSSPGMGVEDFSFFLEHTPGVFYHLGCGNPRLGITAPLHSRKFSLDEDCLSLGIHLQIVLCERLLHKKQLPVPK